MWKSRSCSGPLIMSCFRASGSTNCRHSGASLFSRADDRIHPREEARGSWIRPEELRLGPITAWKTRQAAGLLSRIHIYICILLYIDMCIYSDSHGPSQIYIYICICIYIYMYVHVYVHECRSKGPLRRIYESGHCIYIHMSPKDSRWGWRKESFVSRRFA